MKIVCDSCGTKYSISDEKVRGKVFKIRCKKCSHIIVVRGTSDAAAAPAAATDGGWHLVVDGEQVGPVPESDIRARYERGEINGDTYVWKEGFADWLKLASVPELADLAGGGVEMTGSGEVFAGTGAPVAAANGDGSGRQQASRQSGLFGGVAAAANPADSDVFAAPAPAAARGGGGDLFASPAAASRGAEEVRWPAPAASGAAASHDGGRVESLTGQRHENSVLFSLSNLQSLAMPAAAKPISTTAPTSEGSGLIDIRAMAATTLGSPVEARSGGGGMSDDLPAFGAFSPAAPVLLNLPSQSGPPKWIYPVIGGMVLLVAVIVVLAIKVFSVKPVPAVTEVVPAAPVAATPAQPEAPKAAGTAVPAAASAKPSTIAEGDLPPRDVSKAEGKPEAKSDKGDKTEHHRSHGGSKDKKGSDEKDKKVIAAVAAAAPAAPPEPEVKKPAKGSLDDLLEGALSGNSKARARAPRDDDAPSRKAEPVAAGPLSKGAVVAGMNAIKPKVADCYNQFKVPGMAMVMVVIGKNGKVGTATVTGKFAGTPTGSCVERAVKSASFPPSDGLSTPYPFQLK
jgi:predicted Zn finger-like uncharacterized protein